MNNATPSFIANFDSPLKILLGTGLAMVLVWNSIKLGINWNTNEKPKIARQIFAIIMAAIAAVITPDVVDWVERIMR